jgi:hypothetical protein
VPELQTASTTAELTGGAARTVEDNLVLAIVDVDKVALPTSRARIWARFALDATKIGAAHLRDDCASGRRRLVT